MKKFLSLFLALCFSMPSVSCAFSPAIQGVLGITSAAGDVTSPTLSSSTISADGSTWTFVFDENVSIGAGGNGGWAVTMSVAGAETLTYASGDGTSSLVYTGYNTVVSGETALAGLDYTQPGNGIEDATGNDLASIDDAAVTNNSTAYFADNFTRSDSGTVGGPWTVETDTGTLLALSSGKLVFTQTAATVAYVTKNLGSAHTESWSQFTVAFSDNDRGGNGTYMYSPMFRDAGDAPSMWLEWSTNSSGTLNGIILRYKNNTGDSVNGGTYAFSPVDGQTYTIKIYAKAETSLNAGDGIIRVFVDGTERITKTDAVFGTYADMQYVRFGNTTCNWSDTSGRTVTWDDFIWRPDDDF